MNDMNWDAERVNANAYWDSYQPLIDTKINVVVSRAKGQISDEADLRALLRTHMQELFYQLHRLAKEGERTGSWRAVVRGFRRSPPELQEAAQRGMSDTMNAMYEQVAPLCRSPETAIAVVQAALENTADLYRSAHPHNLQPNISEWMEPVSSQAQGGSHAGRLEQGRGSGSTGPAGPGG